MTVREPVMDLPEEIVAYRPISPAAAVSVVTGLLALLSAALVYDLGVATFIFASVVGLMTGARGLSAVRRYDMAGRGAAKSGLALSVLALATGGGILLYQALNEVPEGCLPITYEALQSKGGEIIPASAKELDGKKVYIKGYMYPSDQTTGIKEFVLCRDNGTCCFGGQPKLTDMIQVKLKEPLALDYHTGLRYIAGNFKVEQNQAPGSLGTVLYHLDADYAK
ncbi:DUF3299 domain-containing protein [Singulisphaera sp. Ch08]|uniref:DUF3299 domain-containing protein n=1 Tax=Singulisphaera sp. Ch08 TaxID=3120278 RepID=A0AAU7CNL6_9BACT